MKDFPQSLRLGSLQVSLKFIDGCLNLSSLARALAEQKPVVWLDSARRGETTGRWSVLGFDPWLSVRATEHLFQWQAFSQSGEWEVGPLEGLRKVLKQYPFSFETREHNGESALSFIGLMGYLSYELNGSIERLPQPQPKGLIDLPEMAWYGMQQVVAVDHLKQQSWFISIVSIEQKDSQRRAEARWEWIEQQVVGVTGECLRQPVVSTIEQALSKDSFEAIVRKVLAYIRNGDIFQANVAQAFTATVKGSLWPLYETLRSVNPSPFAAWLNTDEATMLSCSPERLVRVQKDTIETRPIAGTRHRGLSAGEDALKGLELLLNEKERAEHIMLVDLERNDLGRVCRAGSVKVDELMALESYSHVIHIVSNVIGKLNSNVDAVDVIRAVFPGGTITGCPKVRCMEILRELEPLRRGLYTGAIGWIGFNGNMDLNIVIRTLLVQQQRACFHVGAGIVADSRPEREYAETLAKGEALVEALNRTSSSALPRWTASCA